MSERRSAPRHAARGGGLFHVEGPPGKAPALAVLLDAGGGGVRLLASRPCPPGPAVLVPLPPHPLAGRRLPFRVERTADTPGGGAAAAGPFDPPISDADARALAAGP